MYFNKQCLNSNVTPQFANVKIKNKIVKFESSQINNIHLHTYLCFRYVCMCVLCVYVCVYYVCMYVCTCVCMYVLCVYVCIYMMVTGEQDQNM